MRDDPPEEEVRTDAPAPPASPETPKPAPKHTDLVQDMIGDTLKQYYSKRLTQPLPDKFSALLKTLAEKEGK